MLLSILSPSTKQGSEVEVQPGPVDVGVNLATAGWFGFGFLTKKGKGLVQADTPYGGLEDSWKNKQFGHFFFESQVDG